MKYFISEENKIKAIKKNRSFMALNYGGGILIAILILLSDFDSLSNQSLIYFFGIILVTPFGWWYFDHNFRNKTNTEYEVNLGKLIITEKGKQKILDLHSIKSITKISNAHRVLSGNGKFYILDGLDNKEDLLKVLERTIKT